MIFSILKSIVTIINLRWSFLGGKRKEFKQNLSARIKEHNSSHDKLCEYIDSSPKILVDEIEKGVFEVIHRQDGLHHLFIFLTGHPVIRNYMKELYDLLKLIDTNKCLSDVDKNSYLLEIRSTIRNDVLFLIAVNSLNSQGESVNGYPEYQKILHKLKFFEKAMLSNPTTPNDPMVKDHSINFLSRTQTNQDGSYDSIIYKIHKNEIKNYDEFEKSINDCFLGNENRMPPWFAVVFLFKTAETKDLLEEINHHYDELFNLSKKKYLERKEKYESLVRFDGCVGGQILSIYDSQIQHDINSVDNLNRLLRNSFYNLKHRDGVFFNTPNCTALNHKRLNEDYLYSELLDYCAHHDVKYAQNDAIFFDELQKYINTKKDEVLSRIESTWLHKFDK